MRRLCKSCEGLGLGEEVESVRRILCRRAGAEDVGLEQPLTQHGEVQDGCVDVVLVARGRRVAAGAVHFKNELSSKIFARLDLFRARAAPQSIEVRLPREHDKHVHTKVNMRAKPERALCAHDRFHLHAGVHGLLEPALDGTVTGALDTSVSVSTCMRAPTPCAAFPCSSTRAPASELCWGDAVELRRLRMLLLCRTT